ncbi:MAG: ABC transporter ATP-binding protein/permease [Planctomycetes bacterium]|nr:ABC transporter ATP-binding protein/permease [Planctomycetota bacterium]
MTSSRHEFRAFRRAVRAGQVGQRPEDEAGTEREPASRWVYLREYVGWLRPFAGSITGVFALALVAALLGLILPRATMYIVDKVLQPPGDHDLLHQLGIGLLVIILVQQCLELLRNWQTAKLNARLLFRLRQRLFNRLLRLPLHQLANMKTGGITSRLSGDVDSVTGLLQFALITPGVAIVRIVLTTAVLLWINWQMSLAAVLLLPPVVLLNFVYIRRIRPIYRSLRRDRATIDGRVVETFGGIRVVRAFGREAAEAKRYGHDHHLAMRKRLLALLLEYIIWSGWGFLIPLAALLIIWFGGTLVLRGESTIGSIIAFQMYILMLLQPVSAIVHSYGQMQQALAAMERIFDTLRRPTEMPDRPQAQTAPHQVATIAFEDVSFSYRADQPVLHSFSLEVPGGATVALVGPSGAGKTTVTNLVARFYDPDEGALRLNGVDLRDIRLHSYRRLLGLVQQDVFLFDGTIAENIAYARQKATCAELEDAARRANAHEFIMRFPEGYDTLVGERGVRLSGGQAQRISIARALLADPQILILDEATSNLDSESEQLIQASMGELLADRTTFVIAHRLSTVVSADLIVVIEHGRITETGSHAELMAHDSRYRAMVERQQRGLAEETEAAGWLS